MKLNTYIIPVQLISYSSIEGAKEINNYVIIEHNRKESEHNRRNLREIPESMLGKFLSIID